VGNEAIRDRLHQALRDAMRARDRVAASALRSALAALDNAGAVPPGPVPAAPAAPTSRVRRLRQEAGVLASALDPGAGR
jgi:hypothetical protein